MNAVTVFTVDLGGYPAGMRAHPLVVERAAKAFRGEHGGVIADSFVTRAGGRTACVVTHQEGAEVAALCDDVLSACAETAKETGVFGEGEVQTVTLPLGEESAAEVLVFLTSGAEAGAWDQIFARLYADPFTSSGLVGDPLMRRGFEFVCDGGAVFCTPDETYALLAHLDAGGRVQEVRRRDGVLAAVAGQGADPALLLRVGSGLPDVVTALGVASASGLMPVSLCDMNPTCPKTACLGFSVRNQMLVGPADLYDDPAYERVRIHVRPTTGRRVA
ncbi:fructose 1,6-bisphosphate aldolase/phosphatase [Methanofollis sp. W23]|uniref:fructose 1,6-bisphosphatase n=1 Tax=Methanofollis sp. W23 TaxID=2817849 RepID=UPI001AEA86E5|nr:fructose 1,6-bisphosphatase [Methanofollis sp. W23]MBP2145635.1 fructose 1,6-bisphosphate aldolase/phosphatase [Methanofollis sp. W23]